MLTLLARGVLRAVRNLAAIVFAPGLFRRGALLRAYLPLLGRSLLAAVWSPRLRRPGRARVLGREVEYLALVDFTFGFEEMFVDQQYAFPAGAAPVILDCGSNIGLSLVFFKLAYPDARITAFEPAPDAIAVLRRNVEGLDGIRVEQKALAGEAGELEFFAFPGESASPRSGTLPQTGAVRTAVVEATPLSPYVDGPVDLLKLDVEGRELEVLEELAASGKLASVARIVVEVHHSPSYAQQSVPRLLALLEEQGFAYAVRAPLEVDRWRGAGQDFWLYAVRGGAVDG